MNPTKAVMAAAVVGVLAGCSDAHILRAADVATTLAPVPPGPATTRSTTTQPRPTTTSTTARPATTSTTSTTRRSAATTAAPRPPVASGPGCAPSLASSLAYTGSARQLVTVEASSYSTTYASVELWQRSGSCWQPAGGPWTGRIGANGFSDHHREGDATSPTGFYGLGPVIYGNAADPGVHEAYHRLLCGDWWDEDPTSAGYNTFQHVACGTKPSFGDGSEALWTETAAYPSFAVIDYNTGPVVKGAGSAIFLHADTGSPTVGCVSVPLADLDQALRWLRPADSPAFVMGPAREISRF
jgi:L,D-peptidoglycan transpeptidase YkuD (ErfK/YbiS/YcfS/YnhG family)